MERSAAEKPILNIIGDKVGLGAIGKEGVLLQNKWINNFQLDILSGMPAKPFSMDQSQRWYENDLKEDNPWSQRRITFGIYDVKTLQLIGDTGLRHIDHKNGSAELGILIGEPEYWGKGYGTEAVQLILEYGFSILNLHSVLLRTSGYNERAYKSYLKAGFKLIGRQRESQRWGDKLYDEIWMDCLSTEFDPPTRRLPNLDNILG